MRPRARGRVDPSWPRLGLACARGSGLALRLAILWVRPCSASSWAHGSSLSQSSFPVFGALVVFFFFFCFDRLHRFALCSLRSSLLYWGFASLRSSFKVLSRGAQRVTKGRSSLPMPITQAGVRASWELCPWASPLNCRCRGGFAAAGCARIIIIRLNYA